MIYHRFIIWGVLASILLTVVIMSCGGNADSDPDYPIISEVIEEKAVEPTQQPNLTITPVQISEKIVKKQVPKAQKASEKTLKSSSLSNNEKIAKSKPEVILPTTTALAETPVPNPTTIPNLITQNPNPKVILPTTTALVQTPIPSPTTTPNPATQNPNKNVLDETLTIKCVLNQPQEQISCHANGFDKYDSFKWTTDASSKSGNDSSWIILLEEISIRKVTEIELEACQKHICHHFHYGLDTSPVISNAESIRNETSPKNETPNLQQISEQQKYPPVLKNLLLETIGPFDSASQTFGVLTFNGQYFLEGEKMYGPMLDFGRLGYKKSRPEEFSTNLEFRIPSNTFIYSPIDGFIDRIGWHDSEGKHADWDDWSISIKTLSDGTDPTPDGRAQPANSWFVDIDHLVSIECPRPRIMPDICEKQLIVNGEALALGTRVNAGDILGYAGNLADYQTTGLNGRVELGVLRTTENWWVTEQHCPILFLEETSRGALEQSLREYMQVYENWSAQPNAYHEEGMITPGCHYSFASFDQSKGGTNSEAKWFKQEIDLQGDINAQILSAKPDAIVPSE